MSVFESPQNLLQDIICVVRQDKDHGKARKICRPTCNIDSETTVATSDPVEMRMGLKAMELEEKESGGERGGRALSRRRAHMSKL